MTTALKATIAVKVLASTALMVARMGWTTKVTGSMDSVNWSGMAALESTDDWVSTVKYNRTLAHVRSERRSRKGFECAYGPCGPPSFT